MMDIAFSRGLRHWEVLLGKILCSLIIYYFSEIEINLKEFYSQMYYKGIVIEKLCGLNLYTMREVLDTFLASERIREEEVRGE